MKKIIAKITGKNDVYNFKIEILHTINNFDFLKVNHYLHGDILCQVINIFSELGKLTGMCRVLGYKKNRELLMIKRPFSMDAIINIASDNFIENTLGLNSINGAFIGTLDGHRNIKIHLDIKKMISKHISILAQSGSGKSYTVGVLLEEFIQKQIPILILDPHNEYNTLRFKNNNKHDLIRLKELNLEPKELKNINLYSPGIVSSPNCKKISLDIKSLTKETLIESMPKNLTNAQQNLLYVVLNNMDYIDIDELIFNLSAEDSNVKWVLITMLENLKNQNIFTSNSTKLLDIVNYKQCSIISLKGVEADLKDTFITNLLSNLFEARKKAEIPPFLLVIEEAHNFCPEKGNGNLKSGNIIKKLAGEGRKFGIGLAVITQRPAKIDKNVLSQCSTQVIMKMTNPNDVKPVIQSCEGLDAESSKQIKSLSIGTSLISGLANIPLKVNIRPRITKHGGESTSEWQN
jgi:DNA helicase HerA-like ATPase